MTVLEVDAGEADGDFDAGFFVEVCWAYVAVVDGLGLRAGRVLGRRLGVDVALERNFWGKMPGYCVPLRGGGPVTAEAGRLLDRWSMV